MPLDSALDGPAGRPITDAIDLEGRAQATLSISSTLAQTAALAAGVYDVWCDVDVYISVNKDNTGKTTATSYILKAGNVVPVMVRDQRKIGGITAAASGMLSYHRIM